MHPDKQRFWLMYYGETAKSPLIWEMSRQFDLVFNIRMASVTDNAGLVAIELQGASAAIEQAVRWLQRKGVQVDPVELSTVEG